LESLPLSLRLPDDPTPLSLSEDATERFKRVSSKIRDTLGYLAELTLGSGSSKTTIGTTHTGVSLIESYSKELSGIFGYEGALAKEFEQRHGDIRRANQHIRELEKRLGETQPLDALPGLIDRSEKIVQKWWGSLGFGYIHEWKFTGHGILICTMHAEFSYFGYDSDQPVSRKQTLLERIQQHEEEGLEVLPGENPSHPDTDRHIKDTENNRGYLLNLLNARFPKARISKWESWSVDHREPENLYQIRSFEAVIPYDDLFRNAPVETND
jgi:hypothetical protein